MFLSIIQGFSFRFGLLLAMIPAVWLIKQLPASPEVKKGIEQNAELLELRGEQLRAINRIAESCEILGGQRQSI